MFSKSITRLSWRKLVSSISLIMALVPITLIANYSEAADIKAVPSSARVIPGENFSIDIVVEHIPSGGLGAIQFRLNVNAQGSVVSGIPDITQARTGEISVATPLIIGAPTASRSGIGEFFLNAAGPHGILAMDNEELQNGSGLYTFGHTDGSVPPEGSGPVARFYFAAGKGASAERITVTLSDVMLLNSGAVYPLDSNTGAVVEIDNIPPVVTLISPASGSYLKATFDIAATVTDAVAGVDTVEYQIDGGAWKILPVSDPSSNTCSTSWAPQQTDEGSHAIAVRATDKGGNTSQPVSTTVTIDLTPPAVSVISPVVGSMHSTQFEIAVTATDSVSGVDKVEYQSDGGPWKPLPVSDPSSGKYSTMSVPTSADEGAHTIAFRATDRAGNQSAAATTHRIDMMPPVGAISINNNAPYTRSSAVTLTFYASDGTGSGVAKMCISNTSSCTAWEDYAETRSWTLTSGDGEKTVYAWYRDNLGNSDSAPYVASITLDTEAPALTVSTLSDGSWTNNPLLNVSGQVTDNNGIQQLSINETAVTLNPDGTFSYPVSLQDGPNTFSVVATDLAGNQASDTRTITLDRNAPTITVDVPADNTKTKLSAMNVTGVVDEQSVVTVKVNAADPLPALRDGADFGLAIALVYGINTIEVTATDLAGNTSTVKRTVTFDDRNPALSITDPSQDVQTGQADMVIRGETADLTAIIVTITMDGNMYVPVVTSGTFEQAVTFTVEKTYQIYVTAVDEAGNETVVQRNVVYDTTGPAVTLDPVTSPTNLNSQVLTGTVEAGATVSVTCPTATVGTVTYPTATTWTVSLTDMQEGSNAITVIAADEAGNTSVPVPAAIVVSAINSVANTSPAKLWIGLINSDDQGTQFDLRAELYINGALVSSGETLCVTGVTRNPSYAKEVTVPFNPVSNGAYASGDMLSLKVLTRIGTTSDGQKCSGPGGSHNNAVGLRLYYDAPDRPSRFGAEVAPDPMMDLFLHSSGTTYSLDSMPPTGTVKYKDSSSIDFNNGNPWKEIGTWTRMLQ